MITVTRCGHALAVMFVCAAGAACSSSGSGDTSTTTDSATHGETSGDTGSGPKDVATDTTTPPSDTSSGTDTGSSTDTGSGSDTGSATDTTPPTDTGTCDMPSGGDPCDPGIVVCAGTACDTATHFCCARDASTGTCLDDELAYRRATARYYVGQDPKR